MKNYSIVLFQNIYDIINEKFNKKYFLYWYRFKNELNYVR